MGTVLATAGGMALGDPTLAMAVVLPLALLLSNWGKLGDQGLYGATAALFALSFGEPSVGAAVARLLESLLGAAVGVGVTMLVLPPVYLRSTQRAVDEVIKEVTDTLASIAEGLDAVWDDGQARDWYRRTRSLNGLIAQARSAVEWSEESARLNPHRRHRLRLRNLGSPLRHSLYLFDQLTDYLSDLTRTLVEASDQDADNPRPPKEVTAVYSDSLHRVRTAVEAYGDLVDGDEDGEAARARFREAVDEVRGAYDDLRDCLRGRDASHPEWMTLYGSLLADARRLTGELTAQQSRRAEDL